MAPGYPFLVNGVSTQFLPRTQADQTHRALTTQERLQALSSCIALLAQHEAAASSEARAGEDAAPFQVPPSTDGCRSKELGHLSRHSGHRYRWEALRHRRRRRLR